VEISSSPWRRSDSDSGRESGGSGGILLCPFAVVATTVTPNWAGHVPTPRQGRPVNTPLGDVGAWREYTEYTEYTELPVPPFWTVHPHQSGHTATPPAATLRGGGNISRPNPNLTPQLPPSLPAPRFGPLTQIGTNPRPSLPFLQLRHYRGYAARPGPNPSSPRSSFRKSGHAPKNTQSITTNTARMGP
jgi:hypothetical protein